MAAVAFLALVPVALAQQAGSTARFARVTVAVAPIQAGGGGAAQGTGPTGGIRYVTRPTSRITPILAASSVLAAGGVPVVATQAAPSPAAGGGGLAVAGTATPTGPSLETVQALRTMAAAGDQNARRALDWMGAAGARPSTARRP